MLVGPGVHAVLFKLLEHLVPQSFITWRTSSMAGTGKLTRKRRRKKKKHLEKRKGGMTVGDNDSNTVIQKKTFSTNIY